MKLSPPTGGARKMGLMQNGANERWLVVREDGQLWLHEGGPEAFDRLVTRSELRTRYPRLYAALVASDNKDRPRVVRER